MGMNRPRSEKNGTEYVQKDSEKKNTATCPLEIRASASTNEMKEEEIINES